MVFGKCKKEAKVFLFELALERYEISYYLAQTLRLCYEQNQVQYVFYTY